MGVEGENEAGYWQHSN